MKFSGKLKIYFTQNSRSAYRLKKAKYPLLYAYMEKNWEEMCNDYAILNEGRKYFGDPVKWKVDGEEFDKIMEELPQDSNKINLGIGTQNNFIALFRGPNSMKKVPKKKGHKLYLDDYRKPEYTHKTHDWFVVRSYHEFKEFLEASRTTDWISEVSFDYSLGDPVYTGLDCAKLLVRTVLMHGLPMPKCYVHSTFPDIYENFERIFKDFERKTQNAVDLSLVNSRD